MSGVRAHTHARMSARPSEAKPKLEKASRLTDVLRAGEEERKEKWWVRLPPDVAPQIIGLVKSPLQTCEIVRVLHNDGWYKRADSRQLLQLIRLLFFDIPPNETNTQEIAALAHVQQVLVENFTNMFDTDTPTTDGLKKVLLRLCEGYARALTAIRKMEDPQPWWGETFEWGTGTGGRPIAIPFTATYNNPESTQSTIIDAFVPIQKASALAANYLDLLAAEKKEKRELKARVRARLPPPLRKPWARVPDHVRAVASSEYRALYHMWFYHRERLERLVAETPSVKALPVELQDEGWLPMHDKRDSLDSITIYVDTDEMRIYAYRFFVRDSFDERGGSRTQITELVDEEV